MDEKQETGSVGGQDPVTVHPGQEWAQYALSCGLSMEALCLAAVQYFMARDPLGVETARTTALEHRARQAELEKRIRSATDAGQGKPGKTTPKQERPTAGESQPAARSPVFDEEGHPAAEFDEVLN